MPSPAQIKARKAFVKKYAGKKKGKLMASTLYIRDTPTVKTASYRKKFPMTRERVAKLKAYDIKNKHKNWLRAKEAGISKKEFEKFWKNFTKLY